MTLTDWYNARYAITDLLISQIQLSKLATQFSEWKTSPGSEGEKSVSCLHSRRAVTLMLIPRKKITLHQFSPRSFTLLVDPTLVEQRAVLNLYGEGRKPCSSQAQATSASTDWSIDVQWNQTAFFVQFGSAFHLQPGTPSCLFLS